MILLANKLRQHRLHHGLWWIILILFLSLLIGMPGSSLDAAEVNQNGETSLRDVALVTSNAEKVIFSVTPPLFSQTQVQINDSVWSKIVMPGYANMAMPGKPDLPQMSFVIALPPGATPVLRVLDQEKNVVTGVRVAPTSRQELVAYDFTQPEVAPQFNEVIEFDEVYNQDVLYPQELALLGQELWLRDQRAITVLIRPVQMNAAANTLTVSSHLTVEVAFTFPEGESAGATTTSRPESETYERILQNTLLNYAAATEWRQIRASNAAPQTSPCLSDWNPNTFRVAVNNTGIHQITYTELAAAGLSGTSSSNRLQMCHFNTEIAILVEDGGDGTFGNGDKIVFYGEEIKTQETETNIYWLTIDPDETGLRMQTSNGAPAAGSTPTYYVDSQHIEVDQVYYNLFPLTDANDHWYWDMIGHQSGSAPSILNAPLYVTSLASGAYMVNIRAEVWGFTTTDAHRYRVLLNGTQVGPDQYFYGSGKTSSHLFNEQVSSTALLNGNNTIAIQAISDGTADPSHQMIINWVEIDYRRQFVDDGDRILFDQDTAGTWKYVVSGFASTPDIFDVTNPTSPAKITNATGTTTVTFEQTNAAAFALTTTGARFNSLSITKDTFPSTHLQTTTNQADDIIITDPSLNSSLAPLIAHRTSVNGLSVRTVYVQDIFDEFSYGLYDPVAIKRFLEFTYTDWASPAPTYVLLVGDASYDHRDILGLNDNGNLVPVYLRSGIDSWLGETAADNQYVDFDGNNLADMLLGRIPVKTTAELTSYITKLLAYETAPLNITWHTKHLFVADNGLIYDNANNECNMDPAGDFFATVYNFLRNKFPNGRQFSNMLFYAPTQCYPTNRPSHYAESPIEIQTRFRDALNQGYQFVVYTGHSGTNFWGQNPQLVTISTVNFLTNTDKPAIMLPMTCLEGFYHTPELVSLSEAFVEHPNGGAVASYAPTGLQVQTGHDFLLTGFYKALFVTDTEILGEAILSAKLELYNSSNSSVQDLHDTFMLLGDPAMHMHIWEATHSMFTPVLSR